MAFSGAGVNDVDLLRCCLAPDNTTRSGVVVMGDVVRFRGRLGSGSVDELRALLLTNGGLAVPVGDLDVPADVWRLNARRAGRELGRPVRTGQAQDGQLVWAELRDWPATPDERLRHDAALRAAVVAAAAELPD